MHTTVFPMTAVALDAQPGMAFHSGAIDSASSRSGQSEREGAKADVSDVASAAN